MVIFARLYPVDLCYLSVFFGFAFFFFVAVSFLDVVYSFSVLMRNTLPNVPVDGSCCILPSLPGIYVRVSNFANRGVRNRFFFVSVSRCMSFCLVGSFCVFSVLVPFSFLSLLRVLWVFWIVCVFSRSCLGLPDPLFF